MQVTQQIETMKILSSFKIGSLEIPNRVVFGAHTTNFAEDNVPGERHLLYYLERAKGGAGLIIIEEGYVHDSDFPYEYALLAYRREIIAGYRKIANEIHKYSTKVFAQLGHSGSQADSSIHQKELWSPSGIQTDQEVPKIMEIEDIQSVVQGFAQAAYYVKQAGIDGIELNGGQRSLIRQFMSGLTNQRNDEYGGSLDNRLRFVREIIAAIREKVGRDYPVGLRLTVDEYAPWAGITPEQAEEIAMKLTNDGLLDFFSISVGSIYSLEMTRPSMYIEQGFTAAYAERLKRVTTLPIICGGRIVDAKQAESFLQENKMDFVEMTRAQIADPQLVTKIANRTFEQIRPCIGCNQECEVYGNLNRKLSCVHNIAAGYEKEFGQGTLKIAKVRKRVLVIGGGPSGLEAARIAALKGHEVIVCEMSDSLGGQLRIAKQGPNRSEIFGVITFLQNELERLEVEVRLNTKVTAEMVSALQPDVIIVATGATDRKPYEYNGGNLPHVITCLEAWQGKEIGDNVLIVDEVGGYQATSLIEKLANENKNITVVTSELFPGMNLAQTIDLSHWNKRVYSLGVKMLSRMRVTKITQNEVHLAERYSKLPEVIENIDTVIFCLPEFPEEKLYLELREKFRHVYRSGDCVAPRGIGMAILEGNQVGRRI